MLMIGKPNNIEKYISVKSTVATKLHQLGYQPMYRDLKGNIYFLKTDKIIKVVEEIGI